MFGTRFYMYIMLFDIALIYTSHKLSKKEKK